MADVLSRHHGRDRSDESPKHPPIVLGDCESASAVKRRQYSRLFTVYQLVNKLEGSILIWFDLEGTHFMLLASILSIMFGILVGEYDNRFYRS